MANTETNWILKLVDQVTAPMRKATAATTGMEEAMEGATAAVHMHERAVSQATGEVNDYGRALEGAEEDVRGLERAQNNFFQNSDGWEAAITGVNQFAELAEKAVGALDFAGEVRDLQANIQRMTGATGEELEAMTAQAHRLSKVYGDNGDDIARAANAMTKQMGGSFEDNLALIEKGYLKGANINGNMIDQLQEYSTVSSQLGMSTAQSIALMAEAGKDGIFSDKAFDSLKEADISLKELGQAQVDALAGIGLLPKDVKDKTTFEAVQMISAAMQQAGVTVQEKQAVIADIFRGAGEDAGMKWIEGYGSKKFDMEELVDVEQAGEGLNTFLADLQTSVATTFGAATDYVQDFGMAAVGLTSAMQIVKSLSTVTWIQGAATKAAAGAQWLWNAAMSANPIGIVVAGTAALAAGITLAWNKSEGFRKVVFGLWETCKQVFDNIAGLFKAVFAPVGEAISAVQDGRYADAAKAALKLNPVSMAAAAVEYTAGGGLTKGVEEAYGRGEQRRAESWAQDQKKNKSESDESLLTRTFDSKPPVLDGIVSPDANSKGKKAGNGLSVEGTGAGGSKSLTMQVEIKNYFNNVSSQLDVRRVADQVASVINDRLRDAAIDL